MQAFALLVIASLAVYIGEAALSQEQQDAVVLKHNELRASLGASDMMMLTWSQTLADAAQAHSGACPGSSHSNNRPNSVGENMAQAAGSNFQLTATTDLTGHVQSWFDEKSDSGSYQTGGKFTGFSPCTSVCGHYTQVAWQGANQIGCGVQSCENQFGQGLSGVHLTCQYGTSVPSSFGGNMNDGTSVVFTQGTACSACPSGFQTCSTSPAGLCSSGSSGGTSAATTGSVAGGTTAGTTTGATTSGTTAGITAGATTSASSGATQTTSKAFQTAAPIVVLAGVTMLLSGM